MGTKDSDFSGLSQILRNFAVRMNTKVKNALKYTLSFALAGGLLYLSFRKVGWSEFLAGLRQTDWGWVLLSMGLAVLAFTMRGLRWNQLLRPLDPSIRRGRTISAVCVGNLSNCVIPASGDFVRSGVQQGVTQDTVQPIRGANARQYAPPQDRKGGFRHGPFEPRPVPPQDGPAHGGGGGPGVQLGGVVILIP